MLNTKKLEIRAESVEALLESYVGQVAKTCGGLSIRLSVAREIRLTASL